jgi:NitT/TauT family transport system substrate-binding protein
MDKMKASLALLVVISIVAAGCIGGGDETETPEPTPVQIVYMSGVGTMPSALSNGEVNAYIAWQPMVAVAEVGNIGKVITYSQDLPPDGEWENHPCCALVTTNSFAQQRPRMAQYLTMLMTNATSYINEHPTETAHICADWLFGGEELTYGPVTVDSYEVEEASIPTITFITEPTEKWKDDVVKFVHAEEEIGLVNDVLVGKTDEEIKDHIFNQDIYDAAIASINSGDYMSDEAPDSVPTIDFGYLPSDHDAALFVAAENWEYFRDTYGIYLSPVNAGPNGTYNLVINGTTMARINLIEFSAGSAAMTAASQGNIDYSIIGVPPAILFIDQGAPVQIVSPLQTEGSGVVVSNDATYDDWDGFVEWVKQQQADGKTVKIGTPMLGSIQDVMIKRALKEEGIAYVE